MLGACDGKKGGRKGLTGRVEALAAGIQVAKGRSKRERGVTQDNSSREARDRRKVASSNSLEEGR